MQTKKSWFQLCSRQPAGLGLLLAGAVWFSPGVSVQRSLAQPNFPLNPSGNTTASLYQADESTFSIGVVQVQVNTNFAWLMAPTNPSGTYYPGYSPSSGILTTPVMYDTLTMIGSSALEDWISGPNTLIPFAYPVKVGSPNAGGFATLFPNMSSIGGGDYYSIPDGFAGSGNPNPTAGYQMINTEIEMFDLECGTGEFSCGTDVRVPGPSVTLDMVTAGPEAGGGQPGLGGWADSNLPDLTRRSIGMVEQQSTSPGIVAKSFFNIYVQVNLPSVTQTYSDTAFPGPDTVPPSVPVWTGAYPYTFGLAQLYNDYQDPLVITNLNVTNLPPGVVYIHGETTAVPLLFQYANPPFWNANDTFGWITLAGHGVFGCSNNGTSGQPGSNCCASANTTAFLDTTLGTIGNPKLPMAVAYSRTNSAFPTPNMTLNSIVNTVVSGGATNVLDASVSFNSGSVAIRDLTLGFFSNSIALPAPHATVTYNATNVPLQFQIFESGAWFPATGTTNALTLVISNNGTASLNLFYTNPPPVTNYTIYLTSFGSRSTWAGGPVFLQQDPGNPSIGQHTIRKTSTGWAVSTYLDVNVQESGNASTYFSASGPLRLLPSSPPATVAPPPLVAHVLNNTNIVLVWPGGATVQSATKLTGSNVWTSITSSNTFGPYTVPLGAGQKFFRLSTP